MTKSPLRSIPAPERVGDRISIEIVGTYGSATVATGKKCPIIISTSRQDGLSFSAPEFSTSEARSLSLALEAAIAFAEGK